jgi:hypothetical protein
MMNIYARSFMTAARANVVQARDLEKSNVETEKRWLPKGHWWVSSPKDLDLDNL